MDAAEYDHDARGRLPPAYVLALITTPAALRARAAIRLEIAGQDRVAGDTHAEWRSRLVAYDLLRRADAAMPTP
jgi:hypothetical protein